MIEIDDIELFVDEETPLFDILALSAQLESLLKLEGDRVERLRNELDEALRIERQASTVVENVRRYTRLLERRVQEAEKASVHGG